MRRIEPIQSVYHTRSGTEKQKEGTKEFREKMKKEAQKQQRAQRKDIIEISEEGRRKCQELRNEER